MEITTKQVQLEDLSKIRYEVHIGTSKIVDYLDFMILKFCGKYGYGSSGNADAVYMRAIGKAAIEAWEPGGLIIDFSELSYEWGDQIESVFFVGGDKYGDTPFPVALIVGKNSEEAIRTLLVGLESEKGIEEIEWAFKNLEDAWEYIECKLRVYIELDLYDE
ncbi:hypothetical protein BBG47_27545 [Paenibacillus sp. KS1]|uniref:hypothetical protein n=1 Tax=Paenibacillus sp. KS1 TaxID=1849249 RepID=UPI0008064AEA|nr:hypothetical protein [Paenibacillus sp. KS1]OBY76364.1 hypothetical protein BBG47_27545 [Paenibacillus sp. KS1]